MEGLEHTTCFFYYTGKRKKVKDWISFCETFLPFHSYYLCRQEGGHFVLLPRDMKREQLEFYFREYYSMIFRIAFAELKAHADAEDMVQEVFLRFLKYQPEFHGREHEKAWIVRTTINLCRDFQKNKWNQATVGMDGIPETERGYMEHPYIEEDETLWAVLKLPERYRQPLYLFYYEDYSIREIASALGISENTVKTNLRRGRKALKKLLQEAEKS